MSHKKPAKNVTPDADLAAWCAALSSRTEPDVVPAGWLTTVQLGQKLGKNRSTVAALLFAACRAGRVEVKNFRVPSGQRGVYPVPHYRLLK